jgi:outer membrane protein assembly factor BamA
VRWAIVLAAACGGAPPIPPAPTPAPKLPPVAPPAGPTVAWEELAGPVRAVDVIGIDGPLRDEARRAVAAELGAALDRGRLRGELATIFALDGVADVRARGTQLADGIRLVVEVTPQPVVHDVVVREVGGPSSSAAHELVGKPLDPKGLDRAVAQLRAGYRERGFVDVRADWATSPGGGPRVDIAIEIVPGRRLVFAGVELRGANHLPKTELLAEIASDIVSGEPWGDDRVEHASLLVSAAYYDHGFVNVKVDVEPKPATGERGTVVFVISEGDQYRYGALDITGVPAPVPAIGLKRGQLFSRKDVMATIEKLKAATQAKDVVPSTKIDPKKKTIDLTFEVQK